MQDWDTRIKNLKNDIQIAREKYVIPFTNVQPKAPVNTETVKENQNNETNSLQQNDPKPQEKLYIDNDLTSSLNSINTDEESEVTATEEIPTADVNEVLATEETLTEDANELAATEEVLSKINLEENIQDNLNDTGESQVKKTELELLEERGEDNLSDEEVDRMYELRLLRSQKNMNNELRQQEQEELQKADEEIAHLKTLLKPKPKKLPKGYVE